MNGLWNLTRSALFALDGEAAHRLTMRLLAIAPRLAGMGGAVVGGGIVDAPYECLGLRLRNRVGLAAGFDKDGEALASWEQLGFGFVEVGTVTPRPQPGNPRPRLFRVPREGALVNRLGFNNAGAHALMTNLERQSVSIPVGVNIGKNRDTDNADAVADYLLGMEIVYPRADWITLNISSPNTPGLRDLQRGEALRRLIAPLLDRREQLCVRHGRRVPLLVKLSPDEPADELRATATILEEVGIDGLIATNTTLWRPPGAAAQAAGAGGLSGRPLFDRAEAARKVLRDATSLPLIAVGGINHPDRAASAVAAGAAAVQLYTGFVYDGPALVRACAARLGDLAAEADGLRFQFGW